MPDIQEKFDLTQAAVSFYEEHKKPPTVSDICTKANISVLEFYDVFPSRRACSSFFYESLPLQYEAMIIDLDGFKDISPGEKLANFTLTSMDIMSEHPEFIKLTFDELVLGTSTRAELRKNVAWLSSNLLSNDYHIPTGNQLFLNQITHLIIAEVYINIIKYWVEEDFDSSQRTYALTEKLSALFDEIITNAILDKGFDLTRFLLQSNIIKIPVVGELYRLLSK